jgi:hypothetical protein
MYGEPYMAAAGASQLDQTPLDEALLETARTIVLRGFSPAELRRHAAKSCTADGGGDSWRIVDESFAPCLVSLGGRVRLYEGRFRAVRG